jgi:hypothetical protein
MNRSLAAKHALALAQKREAGHMEYSKALWIAPKSQVRLMAAQAAELPATKCATGKPRAIEWTGDRRVLDKAPRKPLVMSHDRAARKVAARRALEASLLAK